MKNHFKILGLTAIILGGAIGASQAASVSYHNGGKTMMGNTVIQAKVCRVITKKTCSPVRKCVTKITNKKRVTTCTVKPQCRVTKVKFCR